MRELRTIVAGSRTFDDYDLLNNTLIRLLDDKYKAGIVNNPTQIKIVSGTAKGADELGEQFACTYGYDVIRFPADWEHLGKRAGYARNEQMAQYASEYGVHGILVAFWDGKSKGTQHMIKLAYRYGLEVHVINFKEKKRDDEST